jgi:S-layer protein Slr4
MRKPARTFAAVAALATLGLGTAQAAASVAFQPAVTYTYSLEGLQLTGAAAVTLPPIRVTFGNALTYQDDVYLRLPGVTSLPALPSPFLVVCTAGPTNTTGAPTLGYVTTVNGGWAFRVTSVSGVTIGDYCDFTPLDVRGASLASSNGTLEYRANRFSTGQLVDLALSTSSIAIKSQFGISGNGLPATAPAYIPLNAEINAFSGRTNFTGASTETVGAGAPPAPFPTRNDSLSFLTTVDGDGTLFTGPTVTVTRQAVTITNGSFTWTDTAPPAGACFDSGIAAFTLWSIDPSSTCNSLTLVGPTTSTTNAGYFQIPGTIVLAPADWTGTAEWSYYLGSTANSGTTELAWDPGRWTLNGVQVYIQYLPYGTGISRIVYLANSGVLDADVKAEVHANGSTFSCDIGTASAQTVTQLTATLDACVAGEGIDSGRVAVLLTITAPDRDIEVYSAYNVGGSDRGTVVNTSNGRGLTYFSGVD